MTRFLLIRHATTNAVGKRLAGRMEGIHLNEEGKAQAVKLAEQLTSLPINQVYSSPLERALQTAEPIASGLQLQARIYENFLELDFGDWTNKLISDIEDDAVFRQFNSFRSTTPIPGGEMMAEAQLRIVKGLQSLCIKHPNETIAVVSHADMIKSAVAWYAGIHLDLFQRIEISPASVSIIEVYDDTARIIVINHTGSLQV
jgi:probable phosphomutase (TIGR03848 family)